MTVEELRLNLVKRTGWSNLKVEVDAGRRQVRWHDEKDYGRSSAIIGLSGFGLLTEVYGRPFRLLTCDEQQFVAGLLGESR